MLSRIFGKQAKSPAVPSSEEVRSHPDEQTDLPTVALNGKPALKKFSSPNWQPGDEIDGRYRIEEIMSGSMGKVYISEHLGWGIKLAIKSPRVEVLADREGMKYILNEANSWIRMGMHPNIAACYYVLALHGIPHLFIEYVDGGSLSDWIKTGKCRDLRTALSLAIQFCHGMEFTHANGIIHRDIKPQNILVTKNALVKITDFGILLRTSDQQQVDALGKTADEEEATTGFRGTPNYASPEQFRDSHRIDRRSDIFSFGICLWLMLCGKKPFKRNYEQSEIPEPEPFVPGTEFPPKLVEVLKKSVAYAPEDRYQSFAEFRAALNEAYVEKFNFACPYAELADIDLRADSLNNRGVSFVELGRTKEATKCFAQALAINDVQPEAVYNLILLKWRTGKVKPSRILRQIEASQQVFTQTEWFERLERAVKRDMLGKQTDSQEGNNYPEFRLCAAKKSLEIFRESQMNLSIQRNITDLLKNKRYSSCHEVLLTAWKANSFKKDPVFSKTYEQLLPVSDKGSLEGGQRLHTFRGTGSPAACLAHLPKTRTIISAGPDGNIILRDFVSKGKARILEKKEMPVHALSVSKNGERIAVGAEDGHITLWATRSGKKKALKTHDGPVTALAFSPDDRSLASGGADGILKIRKLPGKQEQVFSLQDGGAIRSICFFNEGRHVVTGSDDGTLRFWEIGNKDHTKIVEAHALPVVTLSVSPDGKRFASGSADRYLKIWDHSTGLCRSEIKAHDEAITSVLMLPDNKHVVTGCEDDIIKIWNLGSGKCALILNGRGDGIHSLSQGPKPHIFLAGRHDGAVIIWMLIYQLLFEYDK